jgi:cytochrome bd ubiquinol oxidase subunit II
LGNFKSEPFQNFTKFPLLLVFPILTLIGISGNFGIKKLKNDLTGFFFSSIFLMGSFISGIVTIFPNFLPSTNNVNPSLNIYNMTANKYGLSVGIYWWV